MDRSELYPLLIEAQQEWERNEYSMTPRSMKAIDFLLDQLIELQTEEELVKIFSEM